jgi:hypothetical protein
MAEKRLKRPRDPLQLAKLIGDIATGQRKDQTPEKNDSAAVEFARRGGKRGGKARAEKLTAAQRRDIATKAANARWQNRQKS